MALFVDLEDESESEPPESTGNAFEILKLAHRWGREGEAPFVRRDKAVGDDGRENPNKNAVTEALGCYPIIKSIASHIDLNSLDSLSRTCRQIRVNLLQFRTQLLASTLHCENEDIQPDPENTFRYRARAADWYFVETGNDVAGVGKVGFCARDMVRECRRCGKVVCRNCTIKPPAPILLRDRHRRICKACDRAPLASLISPAPAHGHSAHGTPEPEPHLSAETIKTCVCTCPSEGVWLCQPCGRSLRSADMEYKSVWSWRTRYLPSLGGLGVGISEGDRGVPCGRAEECIASHEVEQETDCDAEDAREIDYHSRAASLSSSPGSTNGSIRDVQMGPGYARHEIEGIGGRLKKKLVKMVRVGACVSEFGDEKEMGKFLVREANGETRSWCGWCWRVILKKGEVIQ